jgi:hypothetical protein
MIPPVQQALAASSAVTTIVGTRIYQTVAPQDAALPYIVWMVVSGSPGNNLSDLPDYDDQRVQVDCYSANQAQARQLGEAARYAIEAQTHIVFGPWSDFEADTKLFRWSMDCEWWESR